MDGFGSKLKELRIEKGLTQRKLAERLNISVPTLSHWECDYQEPAFKDLILLCEYFNVTTDELLGLDFQSTSTTLFSFTTEEQQLVEAFRELPADSKKLVLRMVGVPSATKTSKKKA